MTKKVKSSDENERPVELRGAREVAYLLGITQTRVGQLVTDKVIEKNARDKYDIFKVVPAYCEMLRRGRAAGATATPGSLDDSKARKARAEAEITERDAAKQAGELLSAVDVEAVWIEGLTRFRSRLLGLKVKLAPLVAVEDEIGVCEAIIDDHIDSILKELSGDSFADDTFNAAAERAAAVAPVVEQPPPEPDDEPEEPLDDESSDWFEAPAETDSEPVGGQLPDDLAGG